MARRGRGPRAASLQDPESPGAQGFPAGIPFIVGNEGAERFSFYGMRAILKTYLTTLFLHYTAPEIAGEVATKAASSKATAVTHLFMAGVYAFPMLGALLADRWLGKYPVILWLSLVYCAGHGALAIAGRFAETGSFTLAEYGFYIGLALIAVGSGGIKPCVSANVGDQFSDRNRGLVTKVFQIFYFIINFGSFFATLLIPILKDELGPEVAFGVPGLFMGLATLVFWLGRHRFVHVPAEPGGRLGLYDFATSALFFSPVVAIIAAVFVVAHGFSAPSNAGLGRIEYYGLYLDNYLRYMAQRSWPLFAMAGLAMGLGALLFRARQRRQEDGSFLAVLLYAIRHRRERGPGDDFLAPARHRFGKEAADGPLAVLRIVLVFSMVSVFWALFDQHASTWITQAQSMRLQVVVPRYSWAAFMPFAARLPGGGWEVGGWVTLGFALLGSWWLFLWISNRPPEPRLAKAGVLGLSGLGLLCMAVDWWNPIWETHLLKAEQISALNPLMVMLIIPGLDRMIFTPLARRGLAILPLRKMTIGMFLSALAFVAAAAVQARIEANPPGTVSIAWQLIQYFVMTTAEVLVSVTGLEFAYTQAPRSMKSTIMGFWLLCVTFGNVLVAFLAPLEQILELSSFFWLFAALMAAAAVVFSLLARAYSRATARLTAPIGPG